MLLCDLFQNRKERDHDVRLAKGVQNFQAWVRQQVAANRPWDKLAREILTATGDEKAQPAVSYYIVPIGEKNNIEESELVDSVAMAFLGTRVGCARCHNHPLEKLTQDDYYHFAAFFSRTTLRRGNDKGATSYLSPVSREEDQQILQIEKSRAEIKSIQSIAATRPSADAPKKIAELEKKIDDARQQVMRMVKKPGVIQPRTRQLLPPRMLDGTPADVPLGADPRQSLVAWMTDPKNELFSGAMVNRIWKHYMDVGLVEPVDDLRSSNPPSNPALFAALNREFVGHGYDMKHLMRLILNSRTYQLAAATNAQNEQDRRFYSHYYARRLPAEVLLDAISQVTGVSEQFKDYPAGTRAVQVPDPSVPSYFLTLFGRSERVTACECERRSDVTLPQLLHLHVGQDLLTKIKSPQGRLAGLFQKKRTDAELVDDLFMLAFSRRPTSAEIGSIKASLADGATREEVYRDLLWALLNAKEFSFNH